MISRLRNIFFAVAAGTLLLGSFHTAQAYDGKADDIRVSGRVEREYVPDIGYVHFTVLGRGKTSGEAAEDVANNVAAAKRSLLGINIISDAFTTESYSLWPVYNDKNKVVGYEAQNMYKVKVDELNKLGQVIDKLSESGVGNINYLSYDLRNRKLYLQQLLGEALQDARSRASVIANASGRSLGRLLHADTDGHAPRNITQYDMLGVRSSKMNDSAPTVIDAKNIMLTAEIKAIFALE